MYSSFTLSVHVSVCTHLVTLCVCLFNRNVLFVMVLQLQATLLQYILNPQKNSAGLLVR